MSDRPIALPVLTGADLGRCRRFRVETSGAVRQPCPAVLAAIVGMCVLTGSPSLRADLLGVSGEVRVEVLESAPGVATQSDLGQEFVPLTTMAPPAVARAQLQRYDPSGFEVIAAGQGVSVLQQANPILFGSPNDIGMDLGAFSDEPFTRWHVTGSAQQVRQLRLGPGDVGINQVFLTNGQTRSRLFLSGLLLIISENPSPDLTGTRVSFQFNIVRKQVERPDAVVLSGEVALVGGPNGETVVTPQAGVFAGAFMPVIDLGAAVPEFPLVRGLILPGLQFVYEYDFTPGEPFELVLSAQSELMTIPEVGAAAVFGVPQEGLASILNSAKRSDAGSRLAAAVSQHVDTTGQAYAASPNALFSGLAPMCGTTGAALLPLMLIGPAILRPFRRRPRSRLRCPLQ